MLTDSKTSLIIYLVSRENGRQIADLAQLVEQLIRNEQVVGSNPIISSIEYLKPSETGGFFVIE